MTLVGELRVAYPAGGGEVTRRLADICGPRFARAAGAADGVAGAPAQWVAAPGTVEAVTAVLRVAADHDLAVVPRGAGTKLDWGAPPSQVDIVLDTGRLAGVWHQPPGELIVEVDAGTPLRAVQAVLERTGRRLPLDVASPGATIGGVVAADEAGPLRHRHGSPCEQLVAVSYVDATGGVKHAGGAAGDLPGRDLARLLCGSQGALGVLVSATLRVQPAPASRIWVSRKVWTPLEVHNLVEEILTAGLDPAAIEVDLPADRPGPTRREPVRRAARPPGSAAHPAGTAAHPAGSAAHPAGTARPTDSGPGAGRLVVLLEGGPADVADRARKLSTLLGGAPEVATVPPVWWRRYPFNPGDVALRVTVPITDLHAAVYALRDAVGAPVPVRGSVGLGVVHAALPGDLPPDRVGDILDAVRTVLLARDGRCVVLAAPEPVRHAVDLWGYLPELDEFRRVKERFDPTRRLAPGRFTGGI